jgi:glucose-6-phosphate 1-epimerase
MTAELQRLNERYGIPGELDFVAGPGGLATASIRNAAAGAGVCLPGGHVLSYEPSGQEPVLWMSGRSWFQEGRPIRGGIPVCWPWFGTQAPAPDMAHHGCVRTRFWQVRGTESLDAATRITLGLSDDEATRAVWTHRFDLEIEVTVGEGLRVALTARNTDAEPWQCTGALHSYFSVGDVARVKVHGLEGARYVTEVEEPHESRQQGPITIGAEVDRLYSDTDAECAIEDPVLGRRIRIAKEGSRTTVVWNPWIRKSRHMQDFGDEEYHGMLCVETANAGEEVISLAPGKSHCLAATIKAERL